jgi:hypothetical protein
MSQICKFCNQEFHFKNKVAMGGHVASCKKNPKSVATREKQKKSNTKEPINLTLSCLKCGTMFQQSVKPHIFKNNKHKKYCSYKCSNSRTPTEHSRQKSRETLIRINKKRSEEYKKNIPTIVCQNPSCKKQFHSPHWRRAKYCSIKCACYKNGGQRLYSGRSRYHGGWYNGIWMDSSWELKFAKRLDELNISWKKDTSIYFKYLDKANKTRKYYPDFYIPCKNLYIEIKGFWTDASKHKIQYVKDNCNINLLVIESVEKIENFVI